jgi:hypothetical protein
MSVSFHPEHDRVRVSLTNITIVGMTISNDSHLTRAFKEANITGDA